MIASLKGGIRKNGGNINDSQIHTVFDSIVRRHQRMQLSQITDFHQFLCFRILIQDFRLPARMQIGPTLETIIERFLWIQLHVLQHVQTLQKLFHHPLHGVKISFPIKAECKLFPLIRKVF